MTLHQFKRLPLCLKWGLKITSDLAGKTRVVTSEWKNMAASVILPSHDVRSWIGRGVPIALTPTHLDEGGVQVHVVRHDDGPYQPHSLQQLAGPTALAVGDKQPLQHLALVWGHCYVLKIQSKCNLAYFFLNNLFIDLELKHLVSRFQFKVQICPVPIRSISVSTTTE